MLDFAGCVLPARTWRGPSSAMSGRCAMTLYRRPGAFDATLSSMPPSADARLLVVKRGATLTLIWMVASARASSRVFAGCAETDAGISTPWPKATSQPARTRMETFTFNRIDQTAPCQELVSDAQD